jgi:hypothetical protein
MGIYLGIEDAGNVAAVGARLSATGSAFKAQIAGLLQEIAAIEAERPWGNDHFGQGFEHSYFQGVEDHPPARDTAMQGMTGAGDWLIDVGDNTLRGMTMVQGVEAANAVIIKSASLEG